MSWFLVKAQQMNRWFRWYYLAEKECSVNFSEQHKKCCLNLHYNEVNSYMFVNGDFKSYKFKAKDSEIKAAPLCLGNVLKDFSVDKMKRSELYGNFSLIFMILPMIFQLIMIALMLMIFWILINI